MDSGWSELITMLEYKSEWYGRKFQKVRSYYPSSQLCTACGYNNPEVKNPAVREWVCSGCGAKHGRGINVAKNVKQEGSTLQRISTNETNGPGRKKPERREQGNTKSWKHYL